MNVLSCFDGMSCAQIALERAGIEVDRYYASEVDKWAIKVTQANYPNTIPMGDISKLGVLYPLNNGYPFGGYERFLHVCDIDLLIGGSPCQGFSFAGKQLNFDDPRSKLFFEFVRLKNELQPKWFLLENVRMKQEHQDVISEALGVKPVAINSDLFVCQNRPRLYWTNIPIAPLPQRPDWDEQYYQWRRNHFRTNKSGVCPTLTANMGTGGHNVPLHSMDLKDKLTPEECELLQSIPGGYTEGVSNTQRYKMIGNGFTVDVIVHLLEPLLFC